MTIAGSLRLLRERWTTVALLGAGGVLAAAGVSRVQTPVYEAHSQLFVSTASASDVDQLSQGGTVVRQRVASYADLVDSPAVLQPVIDRLRLRTTPARLADAVSAGSPLDTVLVDVQARDASPVRARDIANAVALQLPKLVAALEARSGHTTSPISVTLTRAAPTPDRPTSPQVPLELALGLLVGLGLGLGAVALRRTLATRAITPQQVAALTRAPVLGTVPDDPLGGVTPLIIEDGATPRAEAYRQLRTNIRFLSVDRRVASLVVAGSVPQEGTTTTAANLAIVLAQGGAPVLLVDADLRSPSVAALFGLPDVVGLTSVLIGDATLQDAVHVWRDDLPLEVLTAGPIPPNPGALLSSDRMGELITAYVAGGRTVIVDAPPLLPATDAAALARCTDGALLVARTASTGTDRVAAAVDSLRTSGACLLGAVLTRTPRHRPVGSRDDTPEGNSPLLILEEVLAGHRAGQPGRQNQPGNPGTRDDAGQVLDLARVEAHGPGAVQSPVPVPPRIAFAPRGRSERWGPPPDAGEPSATPRHQPL